jgi:hypothetical protein
MPDYFSIFKKGDTVRIKDSEYLEDFQRTWKYHHNITDEQKRHAGKTDTVASFAYYHGGDVLVELEKAPGVWHEELLEEAVPVGERFIPASDYYQIHPETGDVISWIIVKGKKGEVYRIHPEWIENAERVREVASATTKESFDARCNLPPHTKERWLEDGLSPKVKQGIFMPILATAVFFTVLILSASFITGELILIVIVPALLLPLLLIPRGKYSFARSIRLSNEGLRVTYHKSEKEDYFQWNQVDRFETRWKLSGNVILFTYISRIMDMKNNRLNEKAIALSDDLLQATQNYSRSINPSIEWEELKGRRW